MFISNACVIILYFVYLFFLLKEKKKKYKKETKKHKLKLNKTVTSNIGIHSFVKVYHTYKPR